MKPVTSNASECWSISIEATMREIRHFNAFHKEKSFNYIHGFEVNEVANLCQTNVELKIMCHHS